MIGLTPSLTGSLDPIGISSRVIGERATGDRSPVALLRCGALWALWGSRGASVAPNESELTSRLRYVINRDMTTNETPNNTSTIYGLFQLEWWDGRTGQQVLLEALRTGEFADGCHVYTPEALTEIGTNALEWEIWFSVALNNKEHLMEAFHAIRNSGTRVKIAGGLGTHRDLATGELRDAYDYILRHQRGNLWGF